MNKGAAIGTAVLAGSALLLLVSGSGKKKDGSKAVSVFGKQMRFALPPVKVGGEKLEYVPIENGQFRLKRNGAVIDPSDTNALIVFSKMYLNALRAKRFPELPESAQTLVIQKGDPYVGAQWWFPNCHTLGAGGGSPSITCPVIAIDQYGRTYPGEYGGGSTFTGGFVWMAGKIAPFVIMAFPAAAPYYYAGLAAMAWLGGDLSTEDAALAYGRSQVPPEYQFAYDVGVGVYHGEDPDTAAVNAYLKANPEARPYYEQGKKAAKDAGIA